MKMEAAQTDPQPITFKEWIKREIKYHIIQPITETVTDIKEEFTDTFTRREP